MIVVDTSAWVEYLRGTGSPANLALRRALSAEDELGVVLVRMELLVRPLLDDPVARPYARRWLETNGHQVADGTGTTRTTRCCSSRPPA